MADLCIRDATVELSELKDCAVTVGVSRQQECHVLESPFGVSAPGVPVRWSW